MKKLLQLVKEDIIQIYVAPGTEFGDLNYEEDEDRYEKYQDRGLHYNLLSLLYDSTDDFDSDDGENEDEIIETILASLEKQRQFYFQQKEIEEFKIFKESREKKNSSKTNISGNIYLMKNTRNGYTKIGFTKNNPKFRERTLQSEEPEIHLILSYKGNLQDEENLHNQFDKKCIRGEWFDLNEEDFKEIEDYFSN